MDPKETNAASEKDGGAAAGGRYAARPCSASEFRREYLCMPQHETPRDRWLVEHAKEYHIRTEAYDRSICTGPILHGGIMPETSHQHRAIQRNALAVHRELFEKARNLGFTGDEWRKALHQALREIERQNGKDHA